MSDEIVAYQIRTYREGDEKKLAKLFNMIYRDYAGFVPRTPDFWLWCCKARPGVREEGILIAEVGGEVAGYAVVSDSGQILELCHDSKNAGEEVVLELLETIEEYLKNLRVTSVTLSAPKDDHLVRKACRSLGYAESPLPYAFQISVVDLAGLISEILHLRLKSEKVHMSRKILLKVDRASPIGDDHITLRISNGNLQVEKAKSGNWDFTIETDKQTLTSCIFGSMNLKTGILTKKIRVSPSWKVTQALNFLSLLKLEDPWYVPFSDYG